MDERVKKALDLALSTYEIVVPNSKAILSTLEGLLEVGKTNSLIYLPSDLKLMAIPLIVQLLDHAVMTSAFPMSVLGPKTLKEFANPKSGDVLERICLKAYEALTNMKQ